MPENPAPGWYGDGTGGQRWWNGESWTEHRAAAPAPAPWTPVVQGAVPAKSLGVAYLFLVLLGWFGAHRYYLRRRRTAIFMSVASTAMVVCLLWDLVTWGHVHDYTAIDTVMLWARGIFYMLTLAAFVTTVVWNFVDLFLIPSIARKLNVRIAASRAAGVRASTRETAIAYGSVR